MLLQANGDGQVSAEELARGLRGQQDGSSGASAAADAAEVQGFENLVQAVSGETSGVSMRQFAALLKAVRWGKVGMGQPGCNREQE